MIDVEATTEALHDLRRARRQNRLADVHWIDALYRVYIAALFGAIAVIFLVGKLPDQKLSEASLDKLVEQGPAALGVIGRLVRAHRQRPSRVAVLHLQPQHLGVEPEPEKGCRPRVDHRVGDQLADEEGGAVHQVSGAPFLQRLPSEEPCLRHRPRVRTSAGDPEMRRLTNRGMLGA